MSNMNHYYLQFALCYIYAETMFYIFSCKINKRLIKINGFIIKVGVVESLMYLASITVVCSFH